MLEAPQIILTNKISVNHLIEMHNSSLGLGTYFQLITIGMGREYKPAILNGSKELFGGSLLFLFYYAIFDLVQKPALKRMRQKAKPEPHTQYCLCSRSSSYCFEKVNLLLKKKLYEAGNIIRAMKAWEDFMNNNSFHSSLSSSLTSID